MPPFNGKLPFANKKLGQHFLRGPKFINLITSNWELEDCGILEIGPGPGMLTRALSQKNKECLSYICVLLENNLFFVNLFFVSFANLILDEK